MEDKIFRKLFRNGGSLDINEAFSRVSQVLPDMSKKRVVDKLLEEVEEAKHVTSSGSTDNKPRGRIDGVHLVTKDEMKEEATLLICSATRIEYAALTHLMVASVDLGVEDGDIHMSAIGFDHTYSLTFVIAVSSYSGSFPCYGMTKTLLAMLPNLKKAYKTGGCIGHADMGSIVVSGYDKNNVVLVDRWSSDQGVDQTRRQGFPSETMYDFSFSDLPDLPYPTIRSTTTSGGRSLVGEPQACANYYEWEGSGFYSAVQRSKFGGEFGLVSVVTHNWRQQRFSQCEILDAFQNLTTFWLEFIRSLAEMSLKETQGSQA